LREIMLGDCYPVNVQGIAALAEPVPVF